MSRGNVGILAVLLSLGGASCSSSPAAPAEPEILFEVEWARDWLGTWWVGFYVDSEGDVWAYDRSVESWSPGQPWGHPTQDRSEFTVSELRGKFAEGRTHLGRLDRATVSAMAGRIEGADGAEYFQPNAACNDAGSWIYVGYRRSGEIYRPVVMRREGDHMRQNLSDGGRILGPWLRGLVALHPTMYGAWLFSCASEDWDTLPPAP